MGATKLEIDVLEPMKAWDKHQKVDQIESDCLQ